MNSNLKRGIAAAICALPALTGLAQGTVQEFRNALEVQKRFNATKVYGDMAPVWYNNGNFWYSTYTPEGKEYLKSQPGAKKATPLFDRAKLAALLEKQAGTKVDVKDLNLGNLRVNNAADTLTFAFNGHNWEYAGKKNKLTDKGAIPPRGKERHWMEVDEEKEWGPVVSPDGKSEAFVRENNVWVRNLADRKERQLTSDGNPGRYYSAWLQWSPDSKFVASAKIRPIEKRYVYYVEAAPKDQFQPVLHKQEYAKPGDEMMHRLPVIINTETGKAVTPTSSTYEPQYALNNLRWDADSKKVTFEFNQRGHKLYQIVEMDALTGEDRPIVDEKADTYVQYERKYRYDFGDDKRILWISERDNHGHLYLYDRSKPAAAPVQVTKGDWYVRQVVNVDEANGKLIFTANGVDKDDDPYNIKYYSINLDGSDMKCLTPGKGYHTAYFSPNWEYLVDVVSAPDQAPVASTRKGADGSLIQEISRADISKLKEAGWYPPEVFCAPGRDGKTPIWGIIQRPSNFDPNKKYPIVEYIYQGPHDHFVPKKFSPCHYWLQSMAELGFIVVQVDGMSTAFRSRDFENVCYKNLKDAGLPDHIAWMKAAAKKYPYMDLDRVGIYGCSAGGQESLNAMFMHPDFYKACYSACGCHDNRMDKTWWNELWMGYPVDNAYRECSNIENAHKLKGDLMLVVGELDDNVDPASTMKVADALIKANKEFELVVVPGAHHTMGERYGDHKRFDFFVRKLMKVNPPKWSELPR